MALETALPTGAGDVVVNGNFLLESSQTVVFNPTLMLYSPPIQEQVQAELVRMAPTAEFHFEFSEVPKEASLHEVKNFISTVDENPIAISDDEDDVIFVGEYPNKSRGSQTVGACRKDNGRVRRNPIRKTRSTKNKDALYEDDFAFLDPSDEENTASRKKVLQKDPTYKQWPINVHERPEYNITTKKIETLDYTIRQIQKTSTKKKPRIECVPVRKKSKKNYCAPKRKPRVTIEKKVPMKEIKEAINENFENLKDYLKSAKEYKIILEHSKCKNDIEAKDVKEDKLQIIINQVTLYSIVNDLEKTKVMEKIEMLKSE